MTVTTMFPRTRSRVQRPGSGAPSREVEAATNVRWSWAVIVGIALQAAVALTGLVIFGYVLNRGGL